MADRKHSFLEASFQGIPFTIIRKSNSKKGTVNPLEPKSELNDLPDGASLPKRRIAMGRRVRNPNKMYIDGQSHPVDYVLVYRRSNLLSHNSCRSKIKGFHQTLQRKGLVLEFDENPLRNEVYVKVYAPFTVLTRYADVLKIKMPVPQRCCPKEEGAEGVTAWKFLIRFLLATRLIGWFMPQLGKFPPLKRGFGWPFSRTREYLFDIPDNLDDFFTFNERSYIVSYILRHSKYGEGEFEFGLGKLLRDNIYTAAFCPHEGGWNSESDNMRKLLHDHWAHPGNWCKLQPIDQIRNYFGSEIGLYFAWLGHYLLFLLIATIFCGFFSIYGLVLVVHDPVTDTICTSGKNITMCPLCNTKCYFWRLSDACYFYRFARLVNNENTLVYTIFMAIWGMLLLIYWQREEAALLYRWRLYQSDNFELEPPRPEFTRYLAERRKVVKRRQQDEEASGRTPSTPKKEDDSEKTKVIPFWSRRFPVALATYSTVLLLLALAVAMVIGIIAYRLSMHARLKMQEEYLMYENAYYISTASAAALNLLIIVVMTAVYEYLAVWLTDKELRRTDSAYSDSLTLKLYLLQFVNNYGSIFYIAFLKGKFVGHPGETTTFGMFGNTADTERTRMEECKVGGCLFEVTLQMLIIFVGKQVWNVLKDPIRLYVSNLINMWRHGNIQKSGPFAKDLQLLELDDVELIFENVEMMIQYGFMCFFIAAFPLAPLFACISAIIEIRRSALKFVRFYRRPAAKPVKGIGIWYGILLTITRMSIFTNALLIAITSDVIPMAAFRFSANQNSTLNEYVEYSLSYFNTSHYTEFEKHPKDPLRNTAICRYRQFRNPPWSEKPYELSPDYWKNLAFQLLFIVVFENVLLGSTKVLKWIIPRQGRHLQEKVRRKTAQVTEYILQSEIVLSKVAPYMRRWYRKGAKETIKINYRESNV